MDGQGWEVVLLVCVVLAGWLLAWEYEEDE